MALAMAGGGRVMVETATKKTVSFLHRLSSHSYSLLVARSSFSSSSTATSTVQEGTSETSTATTRRRRRKNFFEVAQFLPNWGIGEIGYLMAKSHWDHLAYKVTKINLYTDGKHGRAWGILYKDGQPSADKPRRIGGVNKRVWKYIPVLEKKEIAEAVPVE